MFEVIELHKCYVKLVSGWALIKVNFDLLQDIGPKVGGWCSFKGGYSFARLRCKCLHWRYPDVSGRCLWRKCGGLIISKATCLAIHIGCQCGWPVLIFDLPTCKLLIPPWHIGNHKQSTHRHTAIPWQSTCHHQWKPTIAEISIHTQSLVLISLSNLNIKAHFYSHTSHG